MKKNTNSMTEHSVNLRKKRAIEAISKKRQSGELKTISIHFNIDEITEIQKIKAENNLTYKQIMLEGARFFKKT